jgi:sulfur-carrier protein
LSAPLKLLYFARLREALGVAKEEVAIPDGVTDIQTLMAWLARRGGVWQEEFAGCRPLRAAVNQMLVANSASFRAGDEIAFFPPVTGG